MSTDSSIRNLLQQCFAGVWGTNPDGNGGVPVLRSTNFGEEGKLDLSSVVIRHIDSSVLAEKKLRTGDTLLEKSGGGPQQPVGRVVFFDATFEAVCSNFIQVCRPNEANDSRFIFYLLDHLYRAGVMLKFQQQTTGLINLKLAEFLNLTVPRPTKNHQEAVARVLSVVDLAIVQTKALIEKQQRIKTGLMHDLLTRGLDAHGHLRSLATHTFKASEVGLIPEEWDQGTIATKAMLHNNLRKPLSAAVRDRMKGVFPYFGPTGIVDFINEYRLEGRFVLIGEDGDHFFRFANQEMTQLANGRFNVNNHAHVMTGKNGCSTEWLYHFFRHRDITYFLTRQGAGRFKLNKAAVLSLPIAVPSPDEQLKIAERLVSGDKLLFAFKEQLTKLKRLKNGLMNDLLSGKIPVTPLLSHPQR